MLKPSVPLTGVPQSHDGGARKRRNMSPTAATREAPDGTSEAPGLDETSRHIILDLDSGRSTSRFDSRHVDTAREIRDILRDRDMPVEGAAGRCSPSRAQADLQRAEQYLRQLQSQQGEQGEEEGEEGGLFVSGVRNAEWVRPLSGADFLGGMPDTTMDGLLSPDPHHAAEGQLSPDSQHTFPGEGIFVGGLAPGEGVSGLAPGEGVGGLTPAAPQTTIHVQMFGSEDAPAPATIGDGHYVINPSVPYPGTPQQNTLHHSTIEMGGPTGLCAMWHKQLWYSIACAICTRPISQ